MEPCVSAAGGLGVTQGAIGSKLVHIFLPLLLLAVVFITLYSLANWLLVASGLLPLDQELANLWLPMLLSAILVGTLIAPRLRILKLSEKRNVPFLYQIFAAAVLFVPTCCAQYYVTTASGKLTHVKSADMVFSAPRTKYYAADTICLDRQNALVRNVNEVTGRNNENLELKIYVLTPPCADAGRPVWIGFIYHDTISNSESNELKESQYNDFLKRSQAEFDTFDPKSVRYLEALGPSADRRNFEKAVSKTGATPKSSPIILVPHQDAFESRNGETLPWTFYSFGIFAGVFLMMILIPSVDQQALADARNQGGERVRDESDTWLAFIVPRRDAYGLPVLIDVNLAVYLAMVFSGLGVMSFQVEDLRAWGANYGPAINGLGAYRLISSQFVHGGILHIASNMYGLVVGGLFLAPVLRKWGLIACYLVCGLGGSLASFMIHPEMTSVGASGAIMGLLGVLLMLAVLGDKRVAAGRSIIFVNCLIFGGLTLAQGAINPGIDNIAHIGGLTVGIVLGVLIWRLSWGAKPEAQSGGQDESAVHLSALH
jgi:membrane associated rhomboid family serine protease